MTILLKVLKITALLTSFIFSQNALQLKKDRVQVVEDENIKIDVLKNDNIKDKSNLELKIIDKPKKGVATLSGNMIEYTPNSNESGSDNFTYSVDIGTGKGTSEVSIKIKPVNDEPTGLSLSNTAIKENKPEGTLIGKLIVEDPDKNDTFNFGLSRDSKDNFRIDGKKLVSKKSFDFEKKNKYTLSIQVSDAEGESNVFDLVVNVENENEAPKLIGDKDLNINHSEDAGKIVARINVQDPDSDQAGLKYKLTKSLDKEHFKITRSGDISFLKEPDFENPKDKNQNNTYNISYRVTDSKDPSLAIEGNVTVNIIDAEETEVKALDKRKFIAWSVDHQPYHILMEESVEDYLKLKYSDDSFEEAVDDGYGVSIQELKPTDQIIIVQQKGNDSEIYEIWYGNGLDYTIIDREKVDWIFSQDIQSVLIAKDQYLNSDSETVFHKSESDRLMASYGNEFSVWHSNNFKMSLTTFSMRSNLLQYASNMRVGNKLIGIPGGLGAGSEFGVATQRSEFGFRLPVSFDFATTNSNKFDLPETDNLGLYARGNIENLFSTNTDFHGLIGFSFYSPSVGNVLREPKDLASDSTLWKAIEDSTENINILDSYALFGATVQVPVKTSFIGRLTATPGIHYIKIAHRLKDKRNNAEDSMYERLFFDQMLTMGPDSTYSFQSEKLNDDDKSFTSLSSFYLRFDLLGKIGEKPNLIERLSFLDFIRISNVPFYEISLQFIPGFNTISTLSMNFSDQIGVSFTRLTSDKGLKGNWMPKSKFWFGINYRANF
jgi:hypothetical protein